MDSMNLQPKQFQLFIKSPLLNQTLTLTLNSHRDTLNQTLTLNTTPDSKHQHPFQTFNDLKPSLLPAIPTSLFPSFFFSLNGKPIPDSTPLSSSLLRPSSLLTLHFKLLGGGGDGGATGAESRDCYLKMYAEKKPDTVDPNERRLSKWTTCALSFEPLKPPCVVDRLGNVFVKENLVNALLSRNLPKAFRHIKGLKDMINVHLSVIPGLGFDDSGSVGAETRFQCPISGLEFNGKCKFFALRRCGHVLSAKAIKEVKSSACLVCHTEFVEDDKIVINGTDEEVAAMREKMEAEKASALSCKAREKRTKKGRSVENAVEESVKNLDDFSNRLSGKKHGIVDISGAEESVPSGKLEVNEKVVANAAAAQAKRFKAVDIAPPNANKKVYASIFTSSSKSNFKETYSCRSLPLGRN